MIQNFNNLKDIRIREGLTVADLSRCSEVNEKTIRDIENGRRLGSEVTRSRIINGLNKSQRNTKRWEYDEVFGQS